MIDEEEIFEKINERWSNQSQCGFSDLAMKEAISISIERGKLKYGKL